MCRLAKAVEAVAPAPEQAVELALGLARELALGQRPAESVVA